MPAPFHASSFLSSVLALLHEVHQVYKNVTGARPTPLDAFCSLKVQQISKNSYIIPTVFVNTMRLREYWAEDKHLGSQ